MPRGSKTSHASCMTWPATELPLAHLPVSQKSSKFSLLSKLDMNLSRSFLNNMLFAKTKANTVVIIASPPTCMRDVARSASVIPTASPKPPRTAAPAARLLTSGKSNSGNSNFARAAASS